MVKCFYGNAYTVAEVIDMLKQLPQDLPIIDGTWTPIEKIEVQEKECPWECYNCQHEYPCDNQKVVVIE